MIDALCGFAAIVRDHGGDVGSAELIDAARALRLTDLADRSAVRTALTLTIAWSADHPGLFNRLVDGWFAGDELDMPADGPTGPPDIDTVGLDADTVDAARIHTDDAVALDTEEAADAGATSRRGDSPGPSPAPGRPGADDADAVSAPGDLAPVPPGDDADDVVTDGELMVELPSMPPDAELELARSALADAVERRRRVTQRGPTIVHPVTALTAALSSEERARLDRVVHLLDRHLDGAASWRRASSARGSIDLRRTMRGAVTSAGLPIDLHHLGRRNDGARLVVLVDLSVSVRGTARLVLHLVHRLRTMRGSVRAFGFVDSCVPIDRAVRAADPIVAIGNVLGQIDVNAASDPGAALRQFWARSHHLVAANTHVLVLGDGRCNGADPAFEVVERITRRSASTTWVSPEPRGAWRLGRGEMERYAALVDVAVTVRSLDDLDHLVARPRRGGEIRPAARG